MGLVRRVRPGPPGSAGKDRVVPDGDPAGARGPETVRAAIRAALENSGPHGRHPAGRRPRPRQIQPRSRASRAACARLLAPSMCFRSATWRR